MQKPTCTCAQQPAAKTRKHRDDSRSTGTQRGEQQQNEAQQIQRPCACTCTQSALRLLPNAPARVWLRRRAQEQARVAKLHGPRLHLVRARRATALLAYSSAMCPGGGATHAHSARAARGEFLVSRCQKRPWAAAIARASTPALCLCGAAPSALTPHACTHLQLPADDANPPHDSCDSARVKNSHNTENSFCFYPARDGCRGMRCRKIGHFHIRLKNGSSEYFFSSSFPS
jgi:hypothetical protein